MLSFETEETIKRIKSHKGVEAVLIVNQEGIPIYSSTSDEEFAMNHAALISQLASKAKSTIRTLDPTNDMTFLRIRSKKHEIMIAPASLAFYVLQSVKHESTSVNSLSSILSTSFLLPRTRTSSFESARDIIRVGHTFVGAAVITYQMTKLLRPADLAQLQHELHKCDSATLSLLRPIIPLKSVQNLLFNFLQDTSKTFQEHLGDPTVRQVLQNICDQNPIAHNGKDTMDLCFELSVKSLQDREKSSGPILQCPIDDAAEDAADQETILHPSVREMKNYHEMGKTKFENGEVYAAMNAFKKAIDSLFLYQEDEHWGVVIDVLEWEDVALRELYVTLCCNVSVCAIQLQDLSLLREFSNKALRVDPKCAKALYARAKMLLVENLHEEAAQVTEEALGYHPGNKPLKKLKLEIEKQEKKFQERQANFEAENAKIAEMQSQTRIEKEEAKKTDDAHAKECARKTLPKLNSKDGDIQELHTYYAKHKLKLLFDFVQLHNSDEGESPLFSCTIADGTDKVVLASDVRASSKKIAKKEASRLAIAKLWEIKVEANALTNEQMSEYEAYKLISSCLGKKCEDKEKNEEIIFIGTSSHDDNQAPGQDACSVAAASCETGDEDEHDSCKKVQPPITPLFVSHIETQLSAVTLLNQLKAQHKIFFDIRFINEDVISQPQQFECELTLNNMYTVSSRAQNKKKAKAEAAEKLVRLAVEKEVFVLPKDYRGRWALQTGDLNES